jgi:hypothetical protein
MNNALSVHSLILPRSLGLDRDLKSIENKINDLSKNMLKISQTIRQMASHPTNDVKQDQIIIIPIVVVLLGWK